MEYKTLELNVVSAKDIKDVNLLSKMDVYAVVLISGDPNNLHKIKTPVHKDGGTNPIWNFSLKFTVSDSLAQQNRLNLEIKLFSSRTVAGDTIIGTVHIPVKELIDNPGDGSFRHVTYQVRMQSGKAKGSLNLSYKFGENVAAPAKATSAPPPVMAYPAAAAGSSTTPPYGGAAYAPPPQQYGYGYPPTQPGYGYPPPQQSGYGYPPQPGYGYPPGQQPGYGYPPQQPGYGYPPGQQPGYGYPPAQQQGKKKNKFGMGLGAGLLGGALGGLLIGDMVSDVGDYDAGYDAGFDDGGGFDF
ncbi:PREDICTED: protein SRC2-like isoform X3 [Lupinus angustifolius]|uniref:protein SRC2-like isoform X3 n=1 Tax=Lupinus angustifolius TaxID=3871 RepID=UPI00092E543B|nr:PREDICTED: protein SRC2-like isoform X3 [Lupinus angustifolius]